ncbi:MAG: response regulator [Verrucomicrobiaceae bacterium]|nr:MAG: response regulator [Verrucomicrobiaceae bacterium]
MVEEVREIIVVDDDSSMSQAIERLIVTSGWKARSFASAEDLMLWDQRAAIVFLILDIQLPGMSGLDLHQHLASFGIRPPVVFITGYDRPIFRQRAEQAGAVAYLTKPFSGQLLTDAIRRHLSAA